MSAPLDLDQLQSFCAIADCGSFTEAARRVNKTQSAVSMQIKRLEERLGEELFLRDGEPLPELRGTLIVLADSGFNDEQAMHWLLAQEDSLGVAPIDALRAGRKAEVRRVAQALGF